MEDREEAVELWKRRKERMRGKLRMEREEDDLMRNGAEESMLENVTWMSSRLERKIDPKDDDETDLSIPDRIGLILLC